jgi:hypothetical protein
MMIVTSSPEAEEVARRPTYGARPWRRVDSSRRKGEDEADERRTTRKKTTKKK